MVISCLPWLMMGTCFAAGLVPRTPPQTSHTCRSLHSVMCVACVPPWRCLMCCVCQRQGAEACDVARTGGLREQCRGAEGEDRDCYFPASPRPPLPLFPLCLFLLSLSPPVLETLMMFVRSLGQLRLGHARAVAWRGVLCCGSLLLWYGPGLSPSPLSLSLPVCQIFTDAVVPEVVKMISVNIFRALPPQVCVVCVWYAGPRCCCICCHRPSDGPPACWSHVRLAGCPRSLG